MGRGAQPTCSIAGCDQAAYVRGWCSAHYHRWQRYGDPLGGGPPLPRLSPTKRFWSRVDQSGPIPLYRPDPGPCWIWTGRLFYDGYGQLPAAGKRVRAHRFSYELLVGPIPAGLVIDHLCRVHACVNPAHLEPVTARENVLRGTSASAMHSAKTHCKRGHPLSGDNLLILATRPERVCRVCHNLRRRKAYLVRKERFAA